MGLVCLYCKKEKTAEEFSQEHVLPRGIGGNLNTYNPFSINDVCSRCNNLSGLFIDGPFIKSWFINNSRADVAKRYCHLTPETILPLVYFGEIEALKQGDKICEFWLGPTGDTIYHFHVPYPEEMDVPPIVGLPPTAYKKDIDHGIVFLFIRSNNTKWLPTIIFSTLSNFKKSTIYLGNGNKPEIERFEEIPKDLKELHKHLISIQGTTHQNRVQVGINFADRFLCKLALGIGSIILNPEFKKSQSADLLRQGMWTKSRTDREQLPIKGTGPLGSKEIMSDLDHYFKWTGGHTFVVMKAQSQLALYSNFYEANSSVILISNEPQHWEGKIGEGLVFVVAPTLSKAVGPIDIAEFIAHRIDSPIAYNLLQDLEAEMIKFSELPPFDV